MKFSFIIFLIFISLSCKKENKFLKQNEKIDTLDNGKNINIYNHLNNVFENETANELNHKGVLFLQENKIDKAKEYFYKAIEIEPNNPVILNNIGNIENQLTNQKLAIKFFKKSIKSSNFTYYDAYFNLGTTYFEIEEYSKSVKALKKILEKSENLTTIIGANYYLTKNYIQLNNCNSAKEYFEKTQKLMKNRKEFSKKLEYLRNEMRKCA